MPLTKKGKKIKRAMQRFYGKVKGTRVFYAFEKLHPKAHLKKLLAKIHG